MKKLVFAITMCMAAMSANSQDYHRDDTLSPFRLVSQLVVNDQPLLYAMK